MPRIKPVEHDDRLSIVEHLDELRSRLVICAFSSAIAFGALLLAERLHPRHRQRPARAGRKPITLGPAESFTTTMTVSAYFALLISLPVILYQLYAFVLPAFTPASARSRCRC